MVKMPHWPLPIWHREINYNLDKTYKLLEAVGSPHLKLPPVIHVAGTNGKGSTIAFMRAMLEAQGLKVHCYTSPHLIRFNERIIIAGSEISDSLVYEMLEITRIAAEKNNIEATFFEGTTIAAFLAFAKVPADIVLIEVGLGGRLDSTNVITPELSVITPISFDHTMYLGEELFLIAGEKAGIIKKNIACISSLQEDVVIATLEQKAKEMDADFIAYEFDFVVRKEEQGFSYISNNKHIHLPIPSLIGDHQYINAATAIAAMEHLKSYSISDEAIVKGVSSAKWMARLQRLTQGNLYKLLPSHFEIWIDGAHNDAGADVLSLWAGDQDDCDIFLICGITKGRDVKSFLKRFVNKVKFVGGMLVESEPSSYQASQISEASISLNIDSLPFASFSDAISHFVKINEKNKAKIIVCGSLYLAGDALSQN